jgi:MSHA biogenesis protein MshL
MNKSLASIALIGLTACTAPNGPGATPRESIRQEMNAAVAAPAPEAINAALMPRLESTAPAKPREPRFSLELNDTPAAQVFYAIAADSRYSMLVHPEVSGNISIRLKDVTVLEALDAIRDMFGYDYKLDGRRISIMPKEMQTRMYKVNYLTGIRNGTSNLRVTSNSLASGVAGTQTQTAGQSAGGGGTAVAGMGIGMESARVNTTSTSDFWKELKESLTAIVGDENGRSIMVSPMTGVIVVKGMMDDQRAVSAYLKAAQIAIERQVILEAKIMEVQLSDSFQSGVNWGLFGQNNIGQLSPNSSLAPRLNNNLATGTLLPSGQYVPNVNITGGPATFSYTNANNGVTFNNLTGTVANPNGAATTLTNGSITSLAGAAMSAGGNLGTMIGMAFQTGNFAAMLNFLETQGEVHVLSSPRIATLNNQKAVLKVGTEETYFSGANPQVVPSSVVGMAPYVTSGVTMQNLFAGIQLDVLPNIDEHNNVTLHVHPMVNSINTVVKTAQVSGTSISLPLATMSISETDSIVRAKDGQIIAIGGLMRQASTDDRSGLPGMPKSIFGQTSKATQKRELVILIKPTIVDTDSDWSEDIRKSRDRIEKLERSDAKASTNETAPSQP